jgi:hypothetical protein
MTEFLFSTPAAWAVHPGDHTNHEAGCGQGSQGNFGHIHHRLNAYAA